MDNPLLSLWQTDTLPHAILLQASREVATSHVDELIQSASLTSADYLILQGEESLKIADARNIRLFTSLTRSKGPLKIVFITDASKLTNEASNALLKTLEEPPAKTHIILAATQIDILLPTIRSRCRHIQLGLAGNAGTNLPAFNTLAGYLEFSKELASKETDLSHHLQDWLLSQSNQSVLPTQKLILKYLPYAKTNVNRRIFLDNFFLELYNLNHEI